MPLTRSQRFHHTMVRLITTVTSIALWLSLSHADAIAQDESQRLADTITASAQARSFAVSMLDSPFISSRQAAVDALGGSKQQWSDYVETNREAAQQQDLRHILTTLASVGGPTVQSQARELLASGTVEEIGSFIDSGWHNAQAQDDRATAWKAAEAPDGSALKSAADTALQDNSPEALSDFATTGEDIARAHDRRREVYELTNSPLPSVAAGAAEAIQVGTDTAIEGFLRYGQFVAASQDSEKMDISQLVEMSITEAETATNENNKAWMQADRAARAAEAARIATEKSRDEAYAADAAQQRAGNAAIAAGDLATQSAHVADEAVAASQEARRALQQTADALSRAASAAARAQAAAASAASAANAAAYDANAAHGARIAAEQARNAAQAAERSAQAYNHAAAAAGYAQSAGQAAGSAAANADAAAAAASDAANAAGISEQAAAEARAGAARARAAADRARAAAAQVDSLVTQIQSLVEDAKTAARDAADHARKAADAADAAAREAGNARYAAQFAGQHAQAATDAAQRSRNNVELAQKTHTIATANNNQRFDDERSFLKNQALAAREVQDAKDNAEAEERKRSDELTDDMNQLLGTLPDSPNEFTPTEESIGTIRRLALAAAQVGTPAVAGAAKIALEGNTNDDLIDFAFQGYPDAKDTDNLNLVSYWALHDPNEALREAADSIGYEDADTIEHFVTVDAPAMRIGPLMQQTWQLRETAGTNTQTAADEALRANTYEELDAFVNGGGYDNARYADQLQQAYNLVNSSGKEVAIAAEAAVTGDRADLNEFITIEQYRRAMLDYQRDAHNAEIDSLLELGNKAADNASHQAANAQAAYQHARGSADQAYRYAREARQWAGQAEESARKAQNHVAAAQQALTFAKQQQQRAHDAAASAEADATQAENNADQATTYAATARAAATNAAASASEARQSANSASQDAAAASQAANDAYTAAWQLELSEMEQARSAAAEGELTIEPQSALDKIRSTLSKEALDLILDLIGITDILKCFHGEFSGCLWTAIGILPIGKAAKLLKAIPAVRKLIAKAGDLKRAFQTSWTKTALDDALIPAACRLTRATTTSAITYSHAIYRTPDQTTYATAASRCPIPPTVQKINGRYPINAQYAGDYWRNGDPTKMPKDWSYGKIRFTDKGFPAFDRFVAPHDPTRMKEGIKTDLQIKPTGDRNKDMSAADKKLGITSEFRKDNKLVWHHHQDCGRMQLIPRDLHGTVRHTGGMAVWPTLENCL